jgi:glycogen debranching enzyme
VANDGAEISPAGLSYCFRLPAHGEWKTCLEVVAATDVLGRTITHTKYGHDDTDARPGNVSLKHWQAAAPRLTSSWPSIVRTYERSITDLAALRFFPNPLAAEALPAAGLPWFMAIFGRDSLLTSFQALPFTSQLAEATLKVLAARQGEKVDDFRDEEPGKILHESRMGELTAFEERPHSPYFGSADATPLFLVLLDEYHLWTGDDALVRALESNARAALDWIDRCAGRSDGYVAYERRNKQYGLENQCWKDSGNSLQYSDGTLPGFPRATCEIQGYVYDAKLRCARLARRVWNDVGLATRLTHEAESLKTRFNRDFWLPERNFFAVARDVSAGRLVDTLTSNIGHLLWSGIVAPEKVDPLVQHLMGSQLYSGWGVRTMAEGEFGYSPIGYHLGTVWPHDNSFIALGLRRCGYAREAARVAFNILEAAEYFDHRLPEAFAGYSRAETQFPVEYPSACSPQAWAAGTPLLLLRVLLGMEPVQGRLLVDPALPGAIQRLELLGVPGRWGRADAIGRGRIPL